MKINIREKVKEYIRVLKMNKIPTKDKFIETLRICALGVVLLGIIGFIFYLIFTIFGL
ncbi:MAG: protein translocase SEC61 complex subunit gamma [Candidatus Aenigmatarchaeota archaeon]